MSKRASVPNTSTAARRVASASPSGSIKSRSSSGHSAPVNGSPQRKPLASSSPQRSFSQASPQRSPQRSLAGPRKVLSFIFLLTFSVLFYFILSSQASAVFKPFMFDSILLSGILQLGNVSVLTASI